MVKIGSILRSSEPSATRRGVLLGALLAGLPAVVATTTQPAQAISVFAGHARARDRARQDNDRQRKERLHNRDFPERGDKISLERQAVNNSRRNTGNRSGR